MYFTEILKKEYSSKAMVPFINYFDYKDDSCAYLQFDPERDGLRVVANRKIGRGQEVNLPAATGTNDWLLMKKGTSSPQKPTLVPFQINLHEQDPMYQQKVEIMGGITGRTFMLSGDINTSEFMEMISFARFYWWTGSEEDLQALKNLEIHRKQTRGIPFNA